MEVKLNAPQDLAAVMQELITDTLPTAVKPQQRPRPQPERKAGLVDRLTVEFLQAFANDSERFHKILINHLDGTHVLDTNQTRVVLRILDIVHQACADIDLHKPVAKAPNGGSIKPPPPAMRT
jgi:hypothetical protein